MTEPRPEPQIGSRVRIVSGLLPGYLATVVAIQETGKLVLEVDGFGERELLVAGRECVEIVS